jgi:hypothetical protein
MFEGKPPRPRDARALDDERQHDFETLRPLSWGDLVARFSAVQEMLSSCDDADECGEASFDAGSARRIAAHHNGKHDINPDISGNGKSPAGTAGPAGLGAEPRAVRK